MKFTLYLMLFTFCFTIVGCGTSKDLDTGDLEVKEQNPRDFPRPGEGNYEENYNGDYNNSSSSSHDGGYSDAQIYPSPKRYPMIMAIDFKKPEVAEKEVLFSTIHEGLNDYFTIYDVEGNSRQILMETGFSSIDIPEDVLFSKFHQADFCVYLWSNVEETVDHSLGTGISFFRPTIGCRIVDTLTGEERANFVEYDKLGQQGASAAENRRRGIRKVAQKIISKIQQNLDKLIVKLRKNTYYIKGTLANDSDREKLRAILGRLESKRELRMKSVNADSAIFEYVVTSHGTNESSLAEIIKGEADYRGLRLNMRTARHLINITLEKESFDY